MFIVHNSNFTSIQSLKRKKMNNTDYIFQFLNLLRKMHPPLDYNLQAYIPHLHINMKIFDLMHIHIFELPTVDTYS